MTQEQKDKLEQAAETSCKQPVVLAKIAAFKAGAQTILDNPQEWGLQDIEDSDERWCEVVDHFKQEADLYRRALERIVVEYEGGRHKDTINRKHLDMKLAIIAKEALKQ